MKAVCTSHVERHNRTMRMQIRRFTRLTDAHSKKWENHEMALALFFAYYNFCRVHSTIGPHRRLRLDWLANRGAWVRFCGSQRHIMGNGKGRGSLPLGPPIIVVFLLPTITGRHSSHQGVRQWMI